jgi:hypothetical protein
MCLHTVCEALFEDSIFKVEGTTVLAYFAFNAPRILGGKQSSGLSDQHAYQRDNTTITLLTKNKTTN